VYFFQALLRAEAGKPPPMSQATLDSITADVDAARCAQILPQLQKGLNEHQRHALHHNEGPALVLAGAGSGKTTVLTRRIARLLIEGVPAEHLFVATFTKKAADQMRERLAELLGPGGDIICEKVWIGTFHGHCLRMLKTEWAQMYGKGGFFQIADENWQLRTARAILADKDGWVRNLPSPPFGLNIRYDPKSAISAVSAVKNRGFKVEEAEQAFRDNNPNISDSSLQTLTKFWRCYEKSKQAKYDLLSRKPSRRLDFDDLLIEALNLLQTNPEARQKYQEQFHYVLIDETQDTSAVQWEMARILGAKHGNIFIVGDVGQAIYSFRGCSPDATLGQYGGAFPNGEIIRLPMNYRSSSTIVQIANELIRSAGIDDKYRLEMAATRGVGDEPSLHEHTDAEEEAVFVAEALKEMVSQGKSFKDCAVLFRTNAYSRCLEEAFVANGIPYVLEGAEGFYGRKEVKDLIAFLQLSVERDGPAADEAVKRIINVPSKYYGKPTHFLGGQFVGQLETQAARAGCSIYRLLVTAQFKTQQSIAVKDFRDMIKEVARAGDTAEARLRKAREIGYDEYLLKEEGFAEDEGNSRLDNLEELCVAAAAFPTPADFLAFVAAQIKATSGMDPGDAVEMMTIHRSKGLEWPVVVMVGFAFGMIPHHRCIQWTDEEKTMYSPDSIEEERRLAYVGITRAKERLFLSWPLQHTTRVLQRTPFLLEMPSLAALPARDPDPEAAEDEETAKPKRKRKPKEPKDE